MRVIAVSSEMIFSGMMRCADCGEPEVFFTGLTEAEKVALDTVLENARAEMEALKDQYDQEYLERYAAFDAYYKERANRAA